MITPSIYAAWNWKEADLPRITQKFSKHGQRLLVYVVENVSMFQYISVFISVVIGFGILYTIFTPMGHGIGENLKPISNVTFFTGIYFSVVTISSLGYGHMHPMGISRAFACIEVLFGLAAVGIMIAKLTSQRLSYHVSRLFGSDAQKRLEDFAANFDTSTLNLHEIMPKLMAAYQNEPQQISPPTEIRSALISGFRELISAFKSECVKLHDYLARETEQDNYFQIVPVDPVKRVGIAVGDAFLKLGQLITSVPSQSRFEIFDDINRQMIFEALSSQKKVCDLVEEYATDEATLSRFLRVMETCETLPTSYFAVPEESQPDQSFQGTNEPQEPPEVDNQHTDSP